MSMLQAAKNNDVAMIKLLLQAGQSPSFANRVGQSALHIAAIWGSMDAGKMLIEAKADINCQNRIRGSTPLHAAAQRDQTAFAKMLLAHGASMDMVDQNGWRPFEYAKDSECRQVLGGPSELLHEAVRAADAPRILALLDSEDTDIDATDGDGRTALGVAVHSGVPLPIVEAVLHGGADPNAREASGPTPLHDAVARSDTAMVELLLRAGADAEIQTRSNDSYRSSGQWTQANGGTSGAAQDLDDADQTALHAALEVLAELVEQDDDDDDGDEDQGECSVQRAERVVEMLLAHGASTNASDANGRNALHCALELEDAMLRVRVVNAVLRCHVDTTVGCGDIGGEEQTPLAWAAARGMVELMEALLEGGADPELPGMGGMRPLHLAARGGKLRAVRTLLAAGASATAPDADGRSAKELARTNRNAALVAALEEAQAQQQQQQQQWEEEGVPERRAAALDRKMRGNERFAERAFAEACSEYGEGLRTLGAFRSLAPEDLDLTKVLFANRALAATYAAKAVASDGDGAERAELLEGAVRDARLSLKAAKHAWPKAWLRLVQALHAAGRGCDALHAGCAAVRICGLGEKGAGRPVLEELRKVRSEHRERVAAMNDAFHLEMMSLEASLP